MGCGLDMRPMRFFNQFYSDLALEPVNSVPGLPPSLRLFTLESLVTFLKRAILPLASKSDKRNVPEIHSSQKI